jgi:hypothetical protein
MTTYSRRIPATLHVHLENGEEWRATDEDLALFGYTSQAAMYDRFTKALAAALATDGLTGALTNMAVNPIRHLVETTVAYGDPFTPDGNSDDAATARLIVAIERALRQAPQIAVTAAEPARD